jgi:hypothetical protein
VGTVRLSIRTGEAVAPKFIDRREVRSKSQMLSGNFTSHTMEGDKQIAKHFVAAVAIRDFMPVEFRP